MIQVGYITQYQAVPRNRPILTPCRTHVIVHVLMTCIQQ